MNELNGQRSLTWIAELSMDDRTCASECCSSELPKSHLKKVPKNYFPRSHPDFGRLLRRRRERNLQKSNLRKLRLRRTSVKTSRCDELDSRSVGSGRWQVNWRCLMDTENKFQVERYNLKSKLFKTYFPFKLVFYFYFLETE